MFARLFKHFSLQLGSVRCNQVLICIETVFLQALKSDLVHSFQAGQQV